jgi:uncharacterized membrane protein HdeD (DUF308 family)
MLRLLRTEPDPRLLVAIGAVLIAAGLWELFFVLFRSESALFAMSAALVLLVGIIELLRAVFIRRQERRA